MCFESALVPTLPRVSFRWSTIQFSPGLHIPSRLYVRNYVLPGSWVVLSIKFLTWEAESTAIRESCSRRMMSAACWVKRDCRPMLEGRKKSTTILPYGECSSCTP